MIEVDNKTFELLTRKTTRQEYYEKRLSEITNTDREIQQRGIDDILSVFDNVSKKLLTRTPQ